jgi:hypothetical protein
MSTLVSSHMAIYLFYSVTLQKGLFTGFFYCSTEKISQKMEIQPADSFFIFPHLIIGLTDFSRL